MSEMSIRNIRNEFVEYLFIIVLWMAQIIEGKCKNNTCQIESDPSIIRRRRVR